MAEHERIDDSSASEPFWPLDDEVFEDGCPDCEAAIRHFLHELEVDLRLVSLDLWIAGWTPPELLAAVRRATALTESSTLMAQILLVDDSHRSEQARPATWRTDIDGLRARTGITDVGAGWLTQWIAAQPSAGQASNCLKAVSIMLADLVLPGVA